MGKISKNIKENFVKPCAFPNCTNVRGSSNVSFHNFPGIKTVREKWKSFCGLKYSDYLCKKSKLCSVHFSQDSFSFIGSNTDPLKIPPKITLKKNGMTLLILL